MSLYVILGLSADASRRDIERAYKRLARRYHPDLNPGDAEAEAIFVQVTEAYETLRDPERRRQYDRHGEVEAAEAPGVSEFRGFDFSFGGGRASAATFGDLFADVLKRSERVGRRAERGPDLHVELEVSFEEALAGAAREITLTRLSACRPCGGVGQVAVALRRCPACQGAGVKRWIRGHMVFANDCGECGGRGQLSHRACGACGGEGVTPRTETLTVRLPAGVVDEARVRLAEQGHAGRRGGPTGHLYVQVRVAPHPTFERDGDDLRLVLPVAVHEAALGTRVQIPTGAGAATLRVPPGTQAGQRFRLRGRGVPSALDGRRGDLIVELRVMMPRLIDERSKELFRELRNLHPEDVRADLWGAIEPIRLGQGGTE